MARVGLGNDLSEDDTATRLGDVRARYRKV